MTEDLDWLTGRGVIACDDPAVADAALDRKERYAGVAVIGVVLNGHEPPVALTLIKRALRSAEPQVCANALQALGHLARLQCEVDEESITLLWRALRDKRCASGCQIRSYACNAADDVAMFVPRRVLPRWLRRGHAGRRQPTRGG
jgi:hypothetical protein